MKMRKAIMVGTAVTGALLMCGAQLSDMTVERKEVPQKNIQIHTTYRGEQRVIVHTELTNQITRAFLVNGKILAAE
jgi:DNA-binding sugar fermentation-stimulating protein